MLAAEKVKVFWQPGCTSCLRTKELLTKSGVGYESINVHGNPQDEELRKLGARSVPSSRAAAIRVRAGARDVIILDLKVQVQERLSPDELVKKLELVLPPRAGTSGRSRRSGSTSPSAIATGDPGAVPHVFRIVEGFLESMQDGAS